MKFGTSTVQNLSGEGFARKLALDLMQARRRTIATGDNHYLQLSPSTGNVTSYTITAGRRAATSSVEADADDSHGRDRHGQSHDAGIRFRRRLAGQLHGDDRQPQSHVDDHDGHGDRRGSNGHDALTGARRRAA